MTTLSTGRHRVAPAQGWNRPPLLSIVVPVYDEQAVLPEFHRRLTSSIAELTYEIEIVYVNDGSKDATIEELEALYRSDGRVAVVDLSRNFGKEIAVTAGLHHAAGDSVIIIDADLQDPPEVIPALVAEWENGYDVVYAERNRRNGESAMKRISAAGFYRLMQGVGRVRLPREAGDFRLLSRRAVDTVNAFKEQHRFMKGLFAWIGFRQKAVLYDRDPRYAGRTKWSYRRLWDLALDGITSFTTAPLKFSSYVGLVTALGAFAYGAFILVRTLIYGNPVPGYPSLVVIILFLGGAQLMAIGILGEYVGRIFDETKHRPLYVVNAYKARAAAHAADKSRPSSCSPGQA